MRWMLDVCDCFENYYHCDYDYDYDYDCDPRFDPSHITLSGPEYQILDLTG